MHIYIDIIQSIIAASTNCHTNESTLTNTYIATLKSLSSNHNIYVLPSDKGGGIVAIDCSDYFCYISIIHIHLHNKSGNIVNNNDDFNERTNILLYKNIPPTLYSQKG